MGSSEKKYIFTFVYHGDEYDLCKMEMRAFFEEDSNTNVLISNVGIDPSRSPFMRDRLEVLFEGSIEEIKEFARTFQVLENTFKVICLNDIALGENDKIPHSERRKVEREVGLCIDAEPELDHPDVLFGLVHLDGRWYFGLYTKSESVWRQHKQRPRSYSTALSTRVARAVSNIAVPHPEGIRAIDPCCGIGTVLIEALSMGIDMDGRDINPLAVVGARENLEHFELNGSVKIGPISEVTEHYDATIIDMPYNLVTYITPEDQLDMLKAARRFSKRMVVVSIETIDEAIQVAGWKIIDRCEAKKGSFSRHVILCE
ncbi:TRM11 family SAM-dependent methyltransferase [Chungangia koreensis]|uniref:TRM11 family SAM-dependent methyltransferase n=1 Tax=Chungangia koreensis TaxID=752657 RepID=A0ABV8X3F8_9LACT